MDQARIAQLLQPFFAASVPSQGSVIPSEVAAQKSTVLSPSQLKYILTYIDILLRWNARINLTAVRQPDQIMTRHFGESLFAARHLFPAPFLDVATGVSVQRVDVGTGVPPVGSSRLIDVGSGAGFPGLPIKIYAPHIHLTLIESNQKKAAFLREVTRSLTLTNVDVFAGRTEAFAAQADVVTLRAVEHFDSALPAAARLVAPVGHLALLIGQAQVDRSRELAPHFRWSNPVPVPLSSNRVLLIGSSGTLASG
jgi:16S rRNA (guanine527-N7)-methyltransferase